MFSNLASYIFGAAPVENGDPAADVQVPQEAEEVVPNIVEKVEEDEWEMVGEESPSLTLGSLNDPTQRSALGSTGSSDPSMDSEDSGDVPASAHREGEDSAFTRTARRLTVPFGSLAATTSLSEVRSIRAAQSLKVKESGKHLTSKALDRRNKAVKHHHVGHSATKNKVPTMALKASGSSRHLKQC